MNNNCSPKAKKSARQLAMDSLIALERDGRYSNLEINSALTSSSLEAADRALYTRLVYGVTERRITLDYIISQYSKIPVEALDPDALTALRLGIYQLTFMDRIPEHAAVSESAGLCANRSRGFVNAILRQYLRDGRKYRLPDKNTDYIHYLSVKHSVPTELCRLFIESVGDEAEDMLEAMNREPHLSLRVNTLKTDAEQVIQLVGGKLSSIAPDIVNTDSFNEAVKSGIDSGLWFIQDEASRIASYKTGVKAGETVIDTCACPGGKSFSMAMDMQNSGKLYSFDLHKNKLSLINSGADRLGIDIIESAVRDAREPAPELIGKADRVLCDAPCSGLGVIAKKPEIRYKDLSAIERLPEIQYGVLCGASEYVRPGGTLVYSTCTVNRKENEDIVMRFIHENDYFALDEMRTFYPHKDGCDGFFLAVLTKKQ